MVLNTETQSAQRIINYGIEHGDIERTENNKLWY